MATNRISRLTIIGRVSLLGASAGVVLGLFEAACLRLTPIPLALQKPHVPPSFWFFAPLLTSVTFGLLGLLAGFLAALPRRRFLGMAFIAGLPRFDWRLRSVCAGILSSWKRLVSSHPAFHHSQHRVHGGFRMDLARSLGYPET